MKNETEQIEKLEKTITSNQKIIKALMQRVEESMASNGNAFSLFEGNIMLTKQVNKRTEELRELTSELKKEKSKMLTHNKELLKAKKSLTAANNYNKAVINSINDNLIVTDTDGVILEINSRACFVLDTTREEVLGEKISSFLIKKDARDCPHNKQFLCKEFCITDEIVEIEKNELKYTHEALLHTSGSYMPILLSASVMQGNERDEKNIIFLLKDMTQFKEMETLLEVERMKTLESAKLASLGEMAGGIAHEINNPITIINSNLFLLKRELDESSVDKEVCLEKVEEMKCTLARISKIITGLRTVSRKANDDESSYVAVRDVVDDALGLCQEKLKSNAVALRINIPKENVDIYCNHVQLSQVLINLLSNAFDAVMDHGHPEKWIEVCATSSEAGNYLAITDSGNGIDKGIQNKMFNPFFTSKEIGKGTGLGLSLSKSIIEKMGGSLEIDNKCQNTSFVIFLPHKLQQSA